MRNVCLSDLYEQMHSNRLLIEGRARWIICSMEAHVLFLDQGVKCQQNQQKAATFFMNGSV